MGLETGTYLTIDQRSTVHFEVTLINLHNLGKSLFFPSATKLWQGNVFTGICHSVDRGVSGRHPRADTPPPQQTPPGRNPLPGPTPPWADNPWADTPIFAGTPRAVGYCSGRYTSYWNVFLFVTNKSHLQSHIL